MAGSGKSKGGSAKETRTVKMGDSGSGGGVVRADKARKTK
jgi:hypothetical protein